MKRILLLLILGAPLAFAADLTVVLTPLRGHLYMVEDNFYLKENSMLYVGDNFVTVIGATWTPETAKLLAAEVKKVTPKPITEVIDTNYHPDRAGGNAYFRSIGAKIISTKQTSDLLTKHWDEMVRYVQKGAPSYPRLPLVLPDKTFACDLNCKAAG
jgi:metallo-beta-lactamase class B